jgi:hypothetical protein
MSSAWMKIWYDINVYRRPRIGEVALADLYGRWSPTYICPIYSVTGRYLPRTPRVLPFRRPSRRSRCRLRGRERAMAFG